jgi:hypothetical protein
MLNTCPYCNKVIAEHYKSNRYYYREHLEDPIEFRRWYTKEIGEEEYIEELEVIDEIILENKLDATAEAYSIIGNFLVPLECPSCNSKLFIGVDDEDNVIVSSKVGEYCRGTFMEVKEEPIDPVMDAIITDRLTGKISEAEAFMRHMANIASRCSGKEKDPPPPPLKQYVYLLLSDHGTKIGRTISFSNRMREFQTKLPFKINQTIYFEVVNNTQTERDLHRKYKSKRLNGEWFNLEKAELNEIIQSLTA